MPSIRSVDEIFQSTPTLEGAGVRLKRAFGRFDPKLDPFLLLDDFGSDNPQDYIQGFPWHPHRGIETITYLFSGSLAHKDSLGNSGVIYSGDIQWMTAGSGIIHQEMPQRSKTGLRGIQLWANLPRSHKMMNPRYRDISSSMIPEIKSGNTVIKIVSGSVDNVEGPVKDVVTNPIYLDIDVPPNTSFTYSISKDNNVFCYILEGEGFFDSEHEKPIVQKHLVVYSSEGNSIAVRTDSFHVRFLLASAKPLREPVAWRGPIVMNTQEELNLAFKEYREGNFIKFKP